MNATPRLHGQPGLHGIGAVLLLLTAMLGCSSFSALKSLSERDVSVERRERNDAAARQFEKARDLAEFESAHARWQQRDPKGCRERLESLLARNPEHLDARLLLAEVLLSDNRSQDAIRCLEPALQSHADDPRVQYTMGLVLDAAGQTDRALAYYQQAARLEPDNELYAVVQQKALEGPRAKNSPKSPPDGVPRAASAERAAVSAVRPAAESEAVVQTSYSEPVLQDKLRPADAILQPASVLADFGLGRPDRPDGAGRARDTAPVESTKRTEPAKSTDRAGGATAIDLLAQAGRALGDGSAADAATLLRRAVSAKPEDPQIPVSAAVLALQHNQPDLAIELIEPAANRFPNSAAAYRILGTAYYRRGDYPSSQRALQQAISLDKTSALSYFLMGCTLAKLGQADAAETQFRQAQLLDPRYADRRAGAPGASP